MLVKRIVNSNGFKIYFWPIFICYLVSFVCWVLFLPMEPGSLKEFVFLCIGNILWLSCLWILVARYRKVKGKSVGKRTIILLSLLTVVCLVAVILTVASIIRLLVH